jgi:gluconate 5-dehydrogenase
MGVLDSFRLDGKVGPDDLKGIAVLFASDASAFITGQVIAVDGGATAI